MGHIRTSNEVDRHAPQPLQARAAEAKVDVDIKYATPKEGVNMDYDTMAILKGSRNVEEAHMFIDYMIRPDVIAKVSRGLGEAMVGINVDDIPVPHRLAERGW